MEQGFLLEGLTYQLHAKWKQVGPVDREHREPMWERFSAATRMIHDKRHEFFKGLRASREELLERKKEILQKFEEVSIDNLKTQVCLMVPEF